MLELKFQNQLGMTSEIPQFEISSQPTPFWVRNRPGNVGPNLQDAKIIKVETGEPSTGPVCSLSRYMWLWGRERGWALLRLDWVVHCYGSMLSVFLLKTPEVSWLRRPFDSSFWSLLFWVLFSNVWLWVLLFVHLMCDNIFTSHKFVIFFYYFICNIF